MRQSAYKFDLFQEGEIQVFLLWKSCMLLSNDSLQFSKEGGSCNMHYFPLWQHFFAFANPLFAFIYTLLAFPAFWALYIFPSILTSNMRKPLLQKWMSFWVIFFLQQQQQLHWKKKKTCILYFSICSRMILQQQTIWIKKIYAKVFCFVCVLLCED